MVKGGRGRREHVSGSLLTCPLLAASFLPLASISQVKAHSWFVAEYSGGPRLAVKNFPQVLAVPCSATYPVPATSLHTKQCESCSAVVSCVQGAVKKVCHGMETWTWGVRCPKSYHQARTHSSHHGRSTMATLNGAVLAGRQPNGNK